MLEELCTNSLGLPFDLRKMRTFTYSLQGTTLWWMHDLHTISYVMRNDKKPTLLLSMHVVPTRLDVSH